MKVFSLLLLTVMSTAYAYRPTGSLCTPNNPDFLEYRYKEQIPICKRNVTTGTKNMVCKRNGVENRKDYIVDHFVSLWASGSNNIDNLYCQPKELNTADLEYSLYLKVKNDEMTVEDARNILIDVKYKMMDKLGNGYE